MVYYVFLLLLVHLKIPVGNKKLVISFNFFSSFFLTSAQCACKIVFVIEYETKMVLI